MGQRAKSFVINNKGYCIVEKDNTLYLFSPTLKGAATSLEEVKEVLQKEAVDAGDIGTIETVLSIFSGRGNSDVLDSNTKVRSFVRGDYRRKTLCG